MNTWKRYIIVKPEDAMDLERASYEFMGRGMSILQSEDAAYGNYLKKEHSMAAAYHLDGCSSLKKAKMLGDSDKHFAMYCAHASALKLNPLLAVHPMIEAYRTHDESDIFKPHPADDLVLKNN
jgi:hypothetical protein